MLTTLEQLRDNFVETSLILDRDRDYYGTAKACRTTSDILLKKKHTAVLVATERNDIASDLYRKKAEKIRKAHVGK